MYKPLIYAVDDCPATRKFYEFALGNEYMVRTFSDGIRAITASKTTQPDLLICDLNMPWMNGYEVVERIREDHPGLQVIIATCMEGAAHEITVEGMQCHYWFKTNKTAELKEIVSCILTKSKN